MSSSRRSLVRLIAVVFCSGLVWAMAATANAAPVAGVFSVDGTRLRSFPSVAAGSSVASGDLDADGTPEVVFGSPPGVRAEVTVYALDGTLRRRFNAFGQGMKAGINVAVGDIAGNGLPQIVVAPRRGAGPRVLCYGLDGRQLCPGFWAYGKKNGSGVSLTTGNLYGSLDVVITGIGPGSRPHLATFLNDGRRLRNYFPFTPDFRAGLTVTAVDVDGNGWDELVVGPQQGRPADVTVVDPASGAVTASFRAFGNFRGGVSLASFGSGENSRVVAGAGRGGGPDVRIYDPTSGQLVGRHFFAFDPSWRGGVTVGTVDVDQNGQPDVLVVPGAPTLSADELSQFERRYVEPTIAGATYTTEHVQAATGFFDTKIIRADLDAGLVLKTVTATAGDCSDDCPTHPLQYYVDLAGGFAGINGGYFCPLGQAGCAAKDGTYFWLWFNSLTQSFVNMAQNQFNTDPVIAVTDGNVPHLIPVSKDFSSRQAFEASTGGTLTALLSNGPLLVQDGGYAVDASKLDSQQRLTKATRVGIGVKGRTLVIFVASRATVRDLAYVGVALGLDYALNLDGGSSTALSFGNRYRAGPGRNIPTAIVLATR